MKGGKKNEMSPFVMAEREGVNPRFGYDKGLSATSRHGMRNDCLGMGSAVRSGGRYSGDKRQCQLQRQFL